MSREVDELRGRVDVLVQAQAAQFSTILKRFDTINQRLATIEASLQSIQDILEPMAVLIYKIAGDHPDSNFERHGE
jgi:chaperonin cofactor prefoldin